MREASLQARSSAAGLRSRLPAIRLLGLVALLAAEGGLLALRFDTDSLRAAGGGAWADWLWRAKFALPPLGIAIVTAAIAFGGDRLRGALHDVALSADGRSQRAWPFLLAHLGAFALFTRLTAFVLEGGFAHASAQNLWIVLWFATAGAVLVLWIGALVPPTALFSVVRRTRAFVFAGVGIGIAAWCAGLFTEAWGHPVDVSWWNPLQPVTFRLVYGLVRLYAADAIVEPGDFTVGTERFAVQIWKSCAGYEGIGLVWVFLAAYLVIERKTLRFPRALLLLPLGTVAIFLANGLRLATLIAIGTWISPDVAMGGFHAYSGSLLFSAVALALVHNTRRSPFFSTIDGPAQEHTSEDVTDTTAAYLAPFLAIVAATMITGAVSAGGLDRLYPMRVLAAAAVLWHYRRAYRGHVWAWSWEAVAVGVAVFVMWMALEPGVTTVDPENALRTGLSRLPASGAALWIAFRVVGSVVTVPIAEELAFRGWLLRRLISADFSCVDLRRFTWVSFVTSSVLFGVMHDRLLAGTLAGMIYALLLYRRGRLSDAVLAHATTNALIALAVLATGRWGLW